MDALVARMTMPESPSIEDYYFEQSPFFVKLCKPTAAELSTRELVGGLYLPVEYWKVLEKSPQALGTRGGVAVGFHNAGKWMTNTLFVDLVQRSWLGSPRGTSAVLREVITASLGLKRSPIVAIERAGRGRDDAALDLAGDSYFDDE